MPTSEHLRAVFQREVAAAAQDSAVGAVTELIAEDRLDGITLGEVVAHYRVETSAHFRDGLLDLVIRAAREALRDHCLTREEVESIRLLKIALRIQAGDFYRYRRAAIADLLLGEVQRLLEDDRIDETEALYQVELQALFDLSYDQYVDLTREQLTRVVDRVVTKITADGMITPEERSQLERQIAALDTVYRFSHPQRVALRRSGYTLRDT